MVHFTSCSGTDVDVLSAFVYNGDKLARIDDFCGSTPPLAVMSNGNRLTLQFKAPSSSTYVRGFSALYRFVTGVYCVYQQPATVMHR